MSHFEIKGTGDGRKFDTGAVRDTAKGKGYYFCISPFMLDRVAKWLEMGAKKYGDRNWEKGMPFHVFVDSAFRHLAKYMMGMMDEDHLAAVIFNVMALIHFEETGREELDDMPDYLGQKILADLDDILDEEEKD